MDIKKMDRIVHIVGLIAACAAIIAIIYVIVCMLLSPIETRIKSGGPKDRDVIHKEIYGD